MIICSPQPSLCANPHNASIVFRQDISLTAEKWSWPVACALESIQHVNVTPQLKNQESPAGQHTPIKCAMCVGPHAATNSEFPVHKAAINNHWHMVIGTQVPTIDTPPPWCLKFGLSTKACSSSWPILYLPKPVPLALLEVIALVILSFQDSLVYWHGISHSNDPVALMALNFLSTPGQYSIYHSFIKYHFSLHSISLLYRYWMSIQEGETYSYPFEWVNTSWDSLGILGYHSGPCSWEAAC